MAVVLIRHGAEGAAPVDAERLFRDQPGARALAAYWPRRTTVIVTGRARQSAAWLDGAVRALLTELAAAGTGQIGTGQIGTGHIGTGQIGAGGPVRGLAELPVAKRQAEIALAAAAGAAGDGPGSGSGGGAARWTELRGRRAARRR